MFVRYVNGKVTIRLQTRELAQIKAIEGLMDHVARFDSPVALAAVEAACAVTELLATYAKMVEGEKKKTGEPAGGDVPSDQPKE